jgi:hypothetical protein
MQLLLSAHPEGMVVGEIGNELGIPRSTLSHHLDKLMLLDRSFPQCFTIGDLFSDSMVLQLLAYFQ